MDDIVVTSKTVEEHIVILGKIWDRLASYRLKIKRSEKCKFAFEEI